MVELIRIPFNEMVAKIKEKTSLSEQEILDKINAKMAQLSGLISKDGAAHIIATELGVKLIECSGKVKDIYAGMKNCEVNGKVQQIYEVRDFKRQDGSAGKVGNFLIGDETGVMRVVCWGDHADVLKQLTQGTIVRITGATARDNQGRTELHLVETSKVIINPAGINIGEVKQRASAVRKEIKDLADGDENVELLGTVVQMFDPKFFEVCPECNARVKDDGGKYNCPTHGSVTPTHSYILNLFLDDGTDNVRCVFFANQAERLLNKSHEEMLTYRISPENFESIKTNALGNILKLVGRVKKNQFFDRIEFIAQLVFTNPDPGEEIARLKEAVKTNDG
ncbi:MAG: OB-fold nucleic acid binding domain-containing protein [Candidatus Woesearchaeota archaeon]